MSYDGLDRFPLASNDTTAVDMPDCSAMVAWLIPLSVSALILFCQMVIEPPVYMANGIDMFRQCKAAVFAIVDKALAIYFQLAHSSHINGDMPKGIHMKQTVDFYPYIQSDGSVKLHIFYSDDVAFYGVCAVDRDSPIVVEVDVPFSMPENITKVVIDKFDKRITGIRAHAQAKIERIESEKQRFLAITCDTTSPEAGDPSHAQV